MDRRQPFTIDARHNAHWPPTMTEDEFRRGMAPDAGDRRAPSLRDVLPCRLGCRSAAVAIVHYPAGCVCERDPLQALCAQHVQQGLQNNEGRVVAWLEPGAKDAAR